MTPAPRAILRIGVMKMDPIKGIQTCNLNGGVIGNCPYKQVLDLLEKQETDADIEGGGRSWWFVCEECRAVIDTSDSYCSKCGRRIRWTNRGRR